MTKATPPETQDGLLEGKPVAQNPVGGNQAPAAGAAGATTDQATAIKAYGFEPTTFYTTKIVAERLGLSIAVLEAWRIRSDSHGPPFHRLGAGDEVDVRGRAKARAVRYWGSDLIEWLSACRSCEHSPRD